MSKLQNVTKQYFYLFPKEPNVDRLKLQITDESIYSVSKPRDAERIIKIIKYVYKGNIFKSTITDATANVGGDTISFAKHFNRVNSVELNPMHCGALENNLKVYKRSNVNIICNNYLKVMTTLKQDIIYLDPPWGGPKYSESELVQLYLGKLDISKIIKQIKYNAKIFVIKAPYNYDYKTFFKKIGKCKKKAFLIRKKIMILVFSFFDKYISKN
tara:strand:+ start:2129 stop:2770 length:642 start_codon:yes stop_codon:yes gene_type:complete